MMLVGWHKIEGFSKVMVKAFDAILFSMDNTQSPTDLNLWVLMFTSQTVIAQVD